jgi:4-amino-4-deoxychorismate lyase
MDNHAYIVNGDFDQRISPLDRGFAYGDGVFRTMRVQGGIPVNWHLHYQKLVADCASIGIVCPSAELFISDIEQLFIQDIMRNEMSVAKIIVTRGEGERGYTIPAVTTPLRVIIKSQLPSYANHYSKGGVNLTVCETRLAHQQKLAGVKHLNRIENVMARMEWRDESIFDGIMLDSDGNVIECTMSNIFARFGDTLMTPKLNTSGVAGVTRQQILALSKPLNLKVTEATMPLVQLLTADEIIICNSLYGVLQAISIGDKTWPIQSLANKLRTVMRYD